MDLSIVKRKLESCGDTDHYGSPEEFVGDMRLIFINCANYYKVNFHTLSHVKLVPTCALSFSFEAQQQHSS